MIFHLATESELAERHKNRFDYGEESFRATMRQWFRAYGVHPHCRGCQERKCRQYNAPDLLRLICPKGEWPKEERNCPQEDC